MGGVFWYHYRQGPEAKPDRQKKIHECCWAVGAPLFEGFGLKHAATHIDGGVTVHQYFEPDFELRTPAQCAVYSILALRPGAGGL